MFTFLIDWVSSGASPGTSHITASEVEDIAYLVSSFTNHTSETRRTFLALHEINHVNTNFRPKHAVSE
jgi:hypothetical protein